MVATGVSVNLGVLGLAIEAVNLGYRVVVPRDTVAGLPEEYADAVLDNTFPLITTLTTVDETGGGLGSCPDLTSGPAVVPARAPAGPVPPRPRLRRRCGPGPGRRRRRGRLR